MTEINGDQARAIAALVAALRPEWDLPGIRAALWEAKERGSPWNVAHAALYAAQDPKNRTPAIIPMAGEHWTKGRELGAGDSLHTARCDRPGHGSYFAHNCGACKADRLAVEGEPVHQAPRTPRVPPERVRQILEAATDPEPEHHPHDDARTRAAGKD